MKRSSTGNYLTVSPGGGEQYRTFVPYPLPPNPPLALDDTFQDLSDRALLALGRLDSISALLPDTSLFLYMYQKPSRAGAELTCGEPKGS